MPIEDRAGRNARPTTGTRSGGADILVCPRYVHNDDSPTSASLPAQRRKPTSAAPEELAEDLIVLKTQALDRDDQAFHDDDEDVPDDERDDVPDAARLAAHHDADRVDRHEKRRVRQPKRCNTDEGYRVTQEPNHHVHEVDERLNDEEPDPAFDKLVLSLQRPDDRLPREEEHQAEHKQHSEGFEGL